MTLFGLWGETVWFCVFDDIFNLKKVKKCLQNIVYSFYHCSITAVKHQVNISVIFKPFILWSIKAC